MILAGHLFLQDNIPSHFLSKQVKTMQLRILTKALIIKERVELNMSFKLQSKEAMAERREKLNSKLRL
jgi:hypothetical protein